MTFFNVLRHDRSKRFKPTARSSPSLCELDASSDNTLFQLLHKASPQTSNQEALNSSFANFLDRITCSQAVRNKPKLQLNTSTLNFKGCFGNLQKERINAASRLVVEIQSEDFLQESPAVESKFKGNSLERIQSRVLYFASRYVDARRGLWNHRLLSLHQFKGFFHVPLPEHNCECPTAPDVPRVAAPCASLASFVSKIKH